MVVEAGEIPSREAAKLGRFYPWGSKKTGAVSENESAPVETRMAPSVRWSAIASRPMRTGSSSLGWPSAGQAAKIADMRQRRERLAPGTAPLLFGVAGYVICRSTAEEAAREQARITDVRASARGYANYNQWLEGTRLEQRVSLEEYSVSNRGLRAGLVGTPASIAEQLDRFTRAQLEPAEPDFWLEHPSEIALLVA